MAACKSGAFSAPLYSSSVGSGSQRMGIKFILFLLIVFLSSNSVKNMISYINPFTFYKKKDEEKGREGETPWYL